MSRDSLIKAETVAQGRDETTKPAKRTQTDVLSQLDRIEVLLIRVAAQQSVLIEALGADEDADQPELDLEGRPAGSERDDTQSLG